MDAAPAGIEPELSQHLRAESEDSHSSDKHTDGQMPPISSSSEDHSTAEEESVREAAEHLRAFKRDSTQISDDGDHDRKEPHRHIRVCNCMQCKGKIVSRATFYRHANLKASKMETASFRTSVPQLNEYKPSHGSSSTIKVGARDDGPEFQPKLRKTAPLAPDSFSPMLPTLVNMFPCGTPAGDLKIPQLAGPIRPVPTTAVPAGVRPSFPTLASPPPPMSMNPVGVSPVQTVDPFQFAQFVPGLAPQGLMTASTSQWLLMELNALAAANRLPPTLLQSFTCLIMGLSHRLGRPDFVQTLQVDLMSLCAPPPQAMPFPAFEAGAPAFAFSS